MVELREEIQNALSFLKTPSSCPAMYIFTCRHAVDVLRTF